MKASSCAKLEVAFNEIHEVLKHKDCLCKEAQEHAKKCEEAITAVRYEEC